jgi:hypothetical protein
MSISIGQSGAGADPSGVMASLAVSSAAAAQIGSAQTVEAEALFGSLGLGTNASAVA